MGTDVGLRTKKDFVLGTKGNKRDSNYGGKVVGGWWFRKKGCETVTVNESIYANDTTCVFVDREDLVRNVRPLYETFEQCGMEIHIKKPTDKKAKTVAMLAALPPAVYDRLHADVGGAATHGGAQSELCGISLYCCLLCIV